LDHRAPKYHECPYCETAPGVWQVNATVHLDIEDEMNGFGVDRHNCVLMDVNRDGLEDMICGVGATKGDKICLLSAANSGCLVWLKK
jgi:hypothetical protein